MLFGALLLAPQVVKHVKYRTQVVEILQYVDPDASMFVHNIGLIYDWVRRDDTLFPQYTWPIHHIFEYLGNNKQGLVYGILSRRVPALLVFLEKAFTYRDDIYALLWYDGHRKYIIVLQNTSEKRPNGWFFGSFALVHVAWWRIESVEIIDSYHPAYNRPGTSITGPEWIRWFLPEREIYFVWANKIGFTYHDGAAIEMLYEKSYPGQRIDGVLFVSTDLFEYILPEFEQKIWEWQFVNAATDLIRWWDKRWKKELYITELQEYMLEMMPIMIRQSINKFWEILAAWYVNFYPTQSLGVSWWFHTFLREQWLTTRFEKNHMYVRESNISFNKIDRFIQKRITIFDERNELILSTQNDIIDLTQLPVWQYSIQIEYSLDVPDTYTRFIYDLEEKYNVQLWPREQHIVWLMPLRATRGVMYVDKDTHILSLTWDQYVDDTFDTPFAHAAYRQTEIPQNRGVSRTDVILRKIK